MHVTACSSCRRLRAKCIRPSLGSDQAETCERCKALGIDCVTIRRRLGRQPGAKNKIPGKPRLKRKRTDSTGQQEVTEEGSPTTSSEEENEEAIVAAHHLPHPLLVLASEARRVDPTNITESPPMPTPSTSSHHSHLLRNSAAITTTFQAWTDRINPRDGHDALRRQLDILISAASNDFFSQNSSHTVMDDLPVFSGRADMTRPDTQPEYDPISLQILTLAEAQHLFDCFMQLLSNGSMHFDPYLHTLAHIRSRSSFLLSTILYSASTFKSICPSMSLHSRLKAHVNNLEAEMRNQHYKSIEIVQALMILATWQEVPSTLTRDKTWIYIAYAITLAIELHLDSPLPYCVQFDPLYNVDNPDICQRLLRNAHRSCLFLYIHDRNHAMVSGHYPIFPDSTITSSRELDKWYKHPQATRWDRGLTGSVSLRKLVAGLQHHLIIRDVSNFDAWNRQIEAALNKWRHSWGPTVQAPSEYDIISRFQNFVLLSTIVQRESTTGLVESQARRHCESLAFEVVCASIHHYKACTSHLNSETFDTSMVTFSALFVVQAIDSEPTEVLSDWSLFRLATLRELVDQLKIQASLRHSTESAKMSVVDAMARQLSRAIKHLLSRKRTIQPPSPLAVLSSSAPFQPQIPMAHAAGIAGMDSLHQFTLADTTMPFMIDDNFLIDDRFSLGDNFADFSDLTWNWNA